MGKQRSRNRIKSRIDELPPQAREMLNEMLADVTNTYSYIAESMTLKGWEISRFSVGRYALRQNAVANRIRDVREQTTALIAAARTNQDVEATEVATSILIDGLTQKIATAQEEFDEMPLEKAGKLLVALQRSAVYKARMRATRAQACHDVEANILAKIREQVQGDLELVARLSAIVSAAATEEAKRHENDE